MAAKFVGETLTLMGVDRTVKFADRPARHSGDESLEEFFARWGEGTDSFEIDNPNAVLVTYRDGLPPAAVTVTLSKPQWTASEPHTISYTAKIIGGGVRPNGRADGAALFIDTTVAHS